MSSLRACVYTLTQVCSKSLSQISPRNNIWGFFGPESVFLAEKREKKRKHRDGEKAAAHTRLLCRMEKRAARRQHQHWFCSHRSAGNYDNNMFPRQLLFDSVSEHLPFLKSPHDNIWYDYKVAFLLRSAHLCACNFVYSNFPSLVSTQCCSSS